MESIYYRVGFVDPGSTLVSESDASKKIFNISILLLISQPQVSVKNLTLTLKSVVLKLLFPSYAMHLVYLHFIIS